MASQAPLAQGGEEIAPYSKHPSELKPYHVCPPPTKERPSCEAIGAPNPQKLEAAGLPVPLLEGSGENKGFSPQDLRSAYKLPAKGGKGITVAVTGFFDDPKAEEDLAVYRERYELPALARCSEAAEEEPCFKKVNQQGEEANYPVPSAGWAEETSLDLDMVSAACPECDILLVEGSEAGPLVQAAVNLGADVVSDSWISGADNAAETSLDHYYDHPGTPILFGSGDSGYGVHYPAASPFTIAVGGTSLHKDKSARGWSESAWSGAGSGCSKYEAKPAWERDEGCEGRTVADVSAVADPATPVSVYDSYQRSFPWHNFGGTSAATPILAGIEGLSEAGAREAGPSAFARIGQGGGLFDPTTGANGFCGSYLCQAGAGYDGPTGWGTPNGPLTLPVAVTEGVTVASEAEATLRGLVNPKGKATEYRFEYGTTTSYGTNTPYKSAGSGSAYAEASQAISGLKGDTTYHYRLTAVNSEGTFHGADRTFATTAPSATTQPATAVHGNDATLNARVNPRGAETSYWFEYGPTSAYGTRAPLPAKTKHLGPGTEAIQASQQIGPLIAHRTYHYRVVAENAAGITYGKDETLATPLPEWPVQLPVAGGAQSLLSISCLSAEDCVVLGKRSTRGPTWRLHDGELSELGEIKEEHPVYPLDLSCASLSWCVAAGAASALESPEASRPLLAGWDGAKWQLITVPVPPGATSGASIEGVSCTSTASCTAVGWFAQEYVGTGKANTLYRRPLIERWDGKAWSYETLPESTARWGSLESVSCTSSSACVAVGYTEPGGGNWSALAERWNGSEWTATQGTQPSSTHAYLQGVSCASAEACMALGSAEGHEGYFADRWDGKAWTVESLPVPVGGESEGPASVSCPSAGYCEALGSAEEEAPSASWPVAFAWSGGAWSEQSTGTPLVGGEYLASSSLTDVACTSASMCIATGEAEGQAMLATYPPPQPPAVTTEAASAITRTAATLNGTVNPEGSATAYRFEYVGQAEFEAHGYESATSVPAPPKAIGSGSSNVSVSQAVSGLTPGAPYRYRLVAESEAGTSYGKDATLTTVPLGPALEPPGGAFPASFSPAGEQTVRLRGGSYPIECKTESGVKALGGEGQLESATTGTASLVLRNCRTIFSITCTTSGQAEGTIKTEALPFRLVYLSDGKPGVLFEPSAKSGLLATASCPFIGPIKLSGSGVLGRIIAPQLGESSSTLTVNLNAPEVSEGKYAQEYVKTEAGAEYGLQVSVNGGEAKPVELEAEPVATFGGKVTLGALQPPAVTTKAAGGVKESEATLNATVNPRGDETSYRFEYVDQANFAKYGYEGATSVPASPKAIGSGGADVAVSQTPSGLEPGFTYHFRITATNGAGTSHGEDMTLRTKAPALELSGTSFPASFSPAGEATVRLRGGPYPIECKTEAGAKALGGEGQLESDGAGTATLILHNCRETVQGSKCTTSGQAEGTVKTEALPFRLVYLSDGKPGVLFKPHDLNGNFAAATCAGGSISIQILGSGVLGKITQPQLGESSQTLTVNLNAPEVKAGEYAQEYAKTEASAQYVLVEVAGGVFKPAALEAEAVAGFGAGKVKLSALEAPQATTEAAGGVKATEATLNATVNPRGEETSYRFEYVDQAHFAAHGYEGATSVPASPKAIGSGGADVAVSQTLSGLEPGFTYHFRIVATNGNGTSYGEDMTFTTKAAGPALQPPGGAFPATFSLAGEQTVRLRAPTPLTCKTESGVKALGGEGQLESATAGTATLVLHNCKTIFGISCTTSGQAEGTIKTEPLPFRLVYLSDGKPGVLFEPNAKSGALATASCPFIGPIKLSGSGVLGKITQPALGESSQTLTVNLNAPETGKEKYAQEYVKTEAGAEYGLQVSVSGGKAEAAELEAEPVASFSGKAELREG